ncbi:hypothetical protein NKR19_g2892 [Coniochaeta hoffmannii]|uniref:Uncharacterized protein n=1 Tax=Coniochaeta hoffmannii TaxID=91930 RepID=A0AA38S9R0_9PEZI|nr:hypothetical protein NKR19_g2892 [Coniochaeta hoffmannii]
MPGPRGTLDIPVQESFNEWTCVHASKRRAAKTYNIRDSPVVTHPSTSLTIAGLSMGERTGSRVFRRLWSYVAIVR